MASWSLKCILEADTTAAVNAVSNSVDSRLRTAMFAHLNLGRLEATTPDEALRSEVINTFSFEGRPVPLIVQTGIWKPAGLEAALTIRTTHTPPYALPPYADEIDNDGFVRYKYRGTDPAHADNRALRAAMANGVAARVLRGR